MLIDKLKEQLKSTELDIKTIKEYWRNAHQKENLKKFEFLSIQEDFWKHPQRTLITKKLQLLRSQEKQYNYIIIAINDLYEFLHWLENDENELKKMKQEIDTFCKSVTQFKIMLLLNKTQDSSNCFLSINAGAGGTESQDWTQMLLRMYVRFCEQEKFSSQVIDYQSGEEAGIKSATLFIKGVNAYGFLKSEHGIHRLVRISPFDTSKRRHTSFAGVMVTPEVPEIKVTINQKDLRIDTYRASGAGGQHVNKTESAVRITHEPTGIVVQCQNERSQMQNKATAMKMLKARLAQKMQEEQKTTLAANAEKRKIAWGSQIRSYILHPYKLVKDHRTNKESPQPTKILDGQLTEFIESYLVWKSK